MDIIFGGQQGTPYEWNVIQGDVLDILSELPRKSATLVIADPPYNTSKDGGRYGFKGKKFIDNAWDIIEDYKDFSDKWFSAVRDVLRDNGTMYVWCYYRSIPYLPLMDWYPLNLLIWKKTNAFPTTMQNSIWSPSCEYAYFLRKDRGKDHTFHIGKHDFARDVFDCPVVTNKRHPSEKPLSIIKEMIRRSTNEGDLVLDLFSGSGTTLQACIELKRQCISVEMDSSYLKIIKDRVSLLNDVLEYTLPA